MRNGRLIESRLQGGFVLFVILLVVVSPLVSAPRDASAVASFVQKITPVVVNSNGAQSVSGTFAAAPVAGNLLVVVCSAAANVSFSTVPTGYSVAAPSVSGTVSQAIFYKISVGGDTSATCTASPKPRAALAIQMYEYSGVLTTGTVNGTATAVGTTNPAGSGTFTPTSSNSLVFAAITNVTGAAPYTSPTSTFTVRSDVSNLLHMGVADRITTATTAQVFNGTNSAANAWRGQIVVFRATASALSADIVDAAGNSISSPSLSFAAKTYDFVCQTNSLVLGTSTQKMRVSNYSAQPGWGISIAPTAGVGALWGDGTNSFDMNDSGGAGCTDGADSDSFGGQLSVKPSTGVITPTGCTNTGVILGTDTAFSQGAVDSIEIASANSSAALNCLWDITGVTLSQTIPAEQAISTGYTLSLTLTIVAK